MSRLTIDLSEQQHKSLKAFAAVQGKTIKQYAIERLFPVEVDEDQAWAELKTLIGKRISEGLAGDAATVTISGIFDEEMTRDEAA